MTKQIARAGLAVCALGLTCADVSAQADRALKVSVEYRARSEFNRDTVQELNERLMLSRLRVRFSGDPSPWLRYVVEAQDSGAVALRGGVDAGPYRNHLDLHQAYVEVGAAEAGWQVRFGRQALPVVEERLVGADAEWDQFGPVFDAVKVSHTRERIGFSVFSGFLSLPGARRPDPVTTADRVSGLSLELSRLGGREDSVTPFVIWKRNHETVDALGRSGHRDMVTPGVRASGALPAGRSYDVEMAGQVGHVAASRVAAWAGHWQVDAPLGDGPNAPTVTAEYNFATGDRRPEDGVHATFDDLYPAAYNSLGSSDPYAWRNIRYPMVKLAAPRGRRWLLQAAFRAYFLATTEDSLYSGTGEPLFANPGAGSSHVGNQALMAATFTASPKARLTVGYARLKPGGFLKSWQERPGLNTLYFVALIRF